MLLGVFVAITLVGWLAGSTVLARDACSGADEDVIAAKTLLGRYRNGEDSVLPELRAVVEHCREAHHRLDVQRIFDFYVGVPRADRTRGVAEYAAFEKIYDRVQAATDEHISTEEWRDLREEILKDLGHLIDRTVQNPDPAPAAYALGLRSILSSQRVRTDGTLRGEQRNLCILNGIDDANRSIQLFTHCGMKVPQMDPILSLAWLGWAQRQLSKAESLFHQVKSLAQYASNVAYQVNALTGLELIATERGDVQQRSRCLLEIAALGPDTLTWNIVKDQGQFLLELDEPRMAAEWLVAHQPKDEVELQEWHFLMYAVTSRAGMTDAARLHAEVLRKSPRAATVGSAEWLAVAQLDLKEGKAAEVLRRLDEVEQPWIDLRRPAAIARLRGEAHFALGHYREAANVLVAALQYSEERESQVSGLDAPPSTTGSVIGEVIGLESVALLARALIASGSELDAATAIENWQSRSLRQGADTASEITAEETKSWAGRFEAGLLTWVIGADTSVVVYVRPDGHAKAATLSAGRHDLEHAVRRLREAAFDADPTKAYRYGEEIQSVILPQEVLAAISPGDGKRLLLCLHGPLETLPFDLLPVFGSEQESSLIPVTLPGLFAEPGIEWTQKAGSAWCILGDPVAALPDDTVPGASRELDEVAALHPGATVHTGPAFVRENVLTGLRSHGCLHLASHLIAGQRSSTSIDDSMSHAAILLSRGERFSVDDLHDAAPKLDLAVLNACYTSSGEKVDAEPVHGVAREFLMSGTRNILVTMWPIEDGAAAHFALAFHRALNEGLSPSRAANFARNELRAAGASPGEWAAFRLIGRD